MREPVTRKVHYDPNNFKVPEFKKDKDGKHDPTDYQAAVALKDFMQKNNELFIHGYQHQEAIYKGTVTFGDKVVQLNDQEKAMFRKLSDGLFRRLDAGDNDTHDNVVGGRDIDKSIKQKTWNLHGDKTSPEGYWKDPAESVSMTKQQAKELLVKHFEEGNGVGVAGETGFHTKFFSYVLNRHENHGKPIEDPGVVEAFMVLRKDLDKVNVGDSKYFDQDLDSRFITLDEIKEWKI